MNSDTIVAIVVALLTSGSVSATVAYWLSSRREEIILRRQKLEELFISLTQWVKTYGIVTLNFHFAMVGKISLNEVYDGMKKIGKNEEKDNLEKIEMIVGVYFPNLQANYDALIAARTETNQVTGLFENDYEVNGPTNGKKYVTALGREVERLEKVESRFKAAIFEISENLSRPIWRKWI